MPDKVVDASVVGAWCFQEPQVDEAKRIMEGFDLVAPRLLAYELASIARRKAIEHPESVAFWLEGLQVGLGLPFIRADFDHTDAVRLALDRKLTSCDASYLLLSQQMGVPLATFDQRLTRAAAGG